MLLPELVLHSKDKKFFNDFVTFPNGSLLIVAEKGFGKHTLLNAVALELVGLKSEYIYEIAHTDNGSVSIDEIKQLKSFFRLKTIDAAQRRVAVIYDAHMMTKEAQNALLKLLEEPPSNCHILMTTSDEAELLPTVISRLWIRYVVRPKVADIENYLLKKSTKDKVDYALKLSDGLPGLTVSIVMNEHTDMVTAVEYAKVFLKNTMYERLSTLEIYTKDKNALDLLVAGLQKVAYSALKSEVAKPGSHCSWKSRVRFIQEAQELLRQNVSAKAVLTKLAIVI